MSNPSLHLSDQRLLLEIEGELASAERAEVQAHLAACWECRARRREMEDAIASFIRAHRREFDGTLPSAEGPRALLRAQIAKLSETGRGSGLSFRSPSPRTLAPLALGLAVLALCILSATHRWGTPGPLVISLPNSSLTPGAATLADRQSVCSEANVKNKAVPAMVQRQVFAEYGIPAAKPDAYEVDYLVTPALGGADDLRNLWPHSYSTVWNAKVKDDLEDRLRAMVCGGSLDLADAQREIAGNWIAAYQKYFHTRRPLAESPREPAAR